MKSRLSLSLLSFALSSAVAGPAAAWTLSSPQPIGTGYTYALEIGDFNGDGRNDLAQAVLYVDNVATNTELRIYLQSSNGTLAAPIKVHFTVDARIGLAVADLDGDRRQEIVFAQGDGISIVDLDPITVGRPRTAPRVRHFPVLAPAEDAINVVTADINRDGKLDIVAQSWDSGATVFFGDGKGNVARRGYIETLGQGQNDLEARDINGDEFDDIIVRGGQGVTGSIHYNNGQDSMAPAVPFNPTGMYFASLGGLASGDFNLDGRFDVVAQHDATSIGLWTQGYDGVLRDPVYLPSDLDARAMVGTDIDADGDDDVVIGTIGDIVDGRFSGTIGVYLQDDYGNLGEEQVFALPETPWSTEGVAVGDLTGDGCPDVVTGYVHGINLLTGLGCGATPKKVDLGVSLGVTPTSVAIRLDAYGMAMVPSPKVDLTLATTRGTLTVGDLPAECTKLASTTTSAQVRCTGAYLAGLSNSTVVIPIVATGLDSRSMLMAKAIATTTATDKNPANNAAQRNAFLPANAPLAPSLVKSLRAPVKWKGVPVR